jgi:GTP pyrophosphokinase
MSHESLVALASEMRYPDVLALYAAVGEGHLAAQTVARRLMQVIGGEEGAEKFDQILRRRSGPAGRAATSIR